MSEEHDLDIDGWEREYPYYTAEVLEKIDNGKGYWNYLSIGVFEHTGKDEKHQIGMPYKRNYSSFQNTFFHVRKGDRHFALYSPDYTSTRIMEIIPGVGWKDIGGEERDSCGFCPTGYYVPSVRKLVSEDDAHPGDDIKNWSRLLDYFPPGSRYQSEGTHKRKLKLRYNDGQYIKAYDRPDGNYRWVWGPEEDFEWGFVTLPPDFGFVSGCVWGDDSSWKTQLLDLSKIEDGILKREERFGYLELPDDLTLDKAINADGCEEASAVGGRTVTITVQMRFDLDKGYAYCSDSLHDLVVAGKKHSDSTWDDCTTRWKASGEELKKRWAEQGERITAEVKAMGGEI